MELPVLNVQKCRDGKKSSHLQTEPIGSSFSDHKLSLFRMVSSSNFFMGNRDITPIIIQVQFTVVFNFFFRKIQVDHESNLTKMELFKREKFVFRMDNGTCNYTALAFIRYFS